MPRGGPPVNGPLLRLPDRATLLVDQDHMLFALGRHPLTVTCRWERTRTAAMAMSQRAQHAPSRGPSAVPSPAGPPGDQIDTQLTAAAGTATPFS